MQSRKPLSYVIFRQANALIRASGLIESEINKALAEQKETDERIELLHSIVLLRSLAVELYLKTMLIINNDDVLTMEDVKTQGIQFPTGRDGHDFLSLFGLLENDMKNLVAQEYGKLDSNVKTYDDLLLIINRIGHTPFVDWRYIYEKRMDTNISILDLTRLAEALCRSAASIKGTKLV